MAEVDRDGLDKKDRKYLETLIDVFAGGPTGVEALAATMNLATDTLSDEIEPYLLREQYIVRSPRGRVATPKAYTVLGRKPKAEAERTGAVRIGLDWLFRGRPAIFSAWSPPLPRSSATRSLSCPASPAPRASRSARGESCTSSSVNSSTLIRRLLAPVRPRPAH